MISEPDVHNATPDVCIVGRGNVATALFKAFESKGFKVVMLSSRTLEPIHTTHRGAHAVSTNAAVTILAVADDAIASVAERIDKVDGVIAHTSGSVYIDALRGCQAAGYGVFYPLQTFSKGRAVDFSQVPFLLETSDTATSTILTSLAKSLSDNVLYADSEQRAALHVAAVFACNFTNALYATAEQLLKEAALPFDIMAPLLRETLEKAISVGPVAAQTGPAKRHDTAVINSHIRRLPPSLAKIYESLTSLIYEQDKLQS